MRFIRCLLVVVVAFLVGARIANAEPLRGVGGYFEPAVFAGGLTDHGVVKDLRAAVGVTYNRSMWSVRVGGLFEATLGDENRYGVGGELEGDWGSGDHAIGPYVTIVGGPDDYRLYLVGARYRYGDFWLGLDAGAYRTTANDGDGDRPLKAAIVVGGVGLTLGGKSFLVAAGIACASGLLVGAMAPRT